MRRDVRRLGQNALLAVGATFLALLAAELVVGRFWSDPNEQTLDAIQAAHGTIETALRRSRNPDRVYELQPNARGFAFNTFVEINSLGFRGPETSLDKQDRYRIAVVGDSIAFGSAMPPQTSFPYLLQDRLRSACRPIEVLNFAVGGYDATQVVATVEDQVTQFNPDLVLWAYCINDITTHSNTLEYFERSIWFANSVFFRSHLIRYLFRGLTRRQLAAQASAKNDPEIFSKLHAGQIEPIGADEVDLRGWMAQTVDLDWPNYFYGREPHLGHLRYAFRRLEQAATTSGFDVAIFVVPILQAEDGQYPYAPVHRIVESEAKKYPWGVIDILGLFSRVGLADPKLRNYPSDRLHPSRFGHELIADAIYEYLDSTGALTCPAAVD